MRGFCCIIASLVLGAVASSCASTHQRVTTRDAADKIVIAYAQKHHLALNDDQPGYYYCDDFGSKGPYYVIKLLRHNASTPADWVGSETAGFYGIDQRDGSIVGWDPAQDIPGAKIPPAAAQKSKPAKSCPS